MSESLSWQQLIKEEYPRVFERFTDRARRVVVLAQEEARMLNHSHIGTEHILLGLIHEGEGVAAKSLRAFDVDLSLEVVRSQVEAIVGNDQQAPPGHIPFTPRAKKVLELSLREALQLGHNYIGTEHILLGLIREGEGVAAQVLVKLGAELIRVRQEVFYLLHGYQKSKLTRGLEGQEEIDAQEGEGSQQCSLQFVPPNQPGAPQLSEREFGKLMESVLYMVEDIFTKQKVGYPLKWSGRTIVGIDWSKGQRFSG